MIRRTYYCDGPGNPDFEHPDDADRCPCHANTFDAGLPSGYLRLTGFGVKHFCTVDCLLRWAGRQEPVTVIDGGLL